MTILNTFTLSYSSFSVAVKSMLQFYFYKIMKAKASNVVPDAYSEIGKLLHEWAEEYVKGQDLDFDKLWEKYKIDSTFGIRRTKLKKPKYLSMIENARNYIDSTMRNTESFFVCEEEVRFTTKKGLKLIGFIDVVEYFADGSCIIKDWKSNGDYTSSYEEHKLQRLFYSWMMWKKKGIIPKKCEWVYIGYKDKTHEDSFTLEEVKDFDKRIDDFTDSILEKGNDVSKYELGEYDTIFNQYLALCQEQQKLRQGNTILAYRESNQLRFPNGFPDTHVALIDKHFSYRPDGYQYSDLYKRKLWDGKRRFLKNNILPFGFIHEIKRVIETANKSTGKKYTLEVIDKRNQQVVNTKYKTQFTPSTYEVRDYQREALEYMEKYKVMCVKSITGSGKTAIASEFIRKANRRSLFLVSRKELLTQTIEEFEEQLGVKCGNISEGKYDVTKQITVATIQSIVAILKRNDASTKELETYLYNVTLCISDECQLVGDHNSYGILHKELKNIEYCIGLSSTPYRSDSTTLEMQALVGFVEYETSKEELERKGYICPIKINFIPVGKRDDIEFDTFHENYDYHITNFEKRNNIIAEISNNHKHYHKILIVVSKITHGKIINELIPGSYFLHGTTPSVERKKMFIKFKKTRDLMVLISTMQIVGAGISINDLSVLINASANGSIIQTLQVVGRLSRVDNKYKKYGYYVDFKDETPMFKGTYYKRRKQLRAEGYDT